ncbi:MAG: ornithine cyclodeaminase [Burkholderiales bacterium RIFCSPHIGHO2_12_FULL_65_48]|uniref:ornithine cyclodeaminase n=1 Tax=unclassified Acidovorax TaxID=2684926 RepID=UPI0008CAA916|nr:MULTISPECIES: ornithine cyclodeaminase [unclassified Acidovorax]OGB12351.1 MAG: ornithine cyclodeaminase [Burkholderiales bacterium RIFCSPHIGHO2_02_FULL_64_19]OGB26042.1 MAG: ornithine cyclodeaminase [Burkholderiales bacterium RIFCSPHIGHO2_12_FULL_65_48]OGB59311.1 MAG: ornithine cyclodeaminase [Burkholderiales bacterium RIFCSPLOWO2_12_FULL_64_33]MBV7458177.1 ornithine cyclodeaminase [Acidovorax sp. sif0632]MBV7464001.1 ornithine cyclodeaminase [Acidovorax sp. sif0613]
MPSKNHFSTLYLSAPDVIELVQRKGVEACLRGIADYIQSDFLRWGAFDKSARVASHSRDGVIELMPIADDQTYAFKYVNGHPKNTRWGLPTVMAFGVLADVATGVPLLLSELTLTTALRTAAMSAVAARALARPGARTMALIGNGAQSEFQALAFHHLLGVTTLRLFDTDPAATAKLQANLQGTGLRTVACSSTAEAVRGANVVTTVTADKSNATILTPDMLVPGMHINAVGGDCPGKTELHADVLRQAQVFVEYTPQTRIEGDIQQLPADFVVTELWEVLAGQHTGRASDAAVTVFDSVGFALEDFSALRFLRDAATELGVGQPIELIPQLSDPKNLFGLLRTHNPLLRAVA